MACLIYCATFKFKVNADERKKITDVSHISFYSHRHSHARKLSVTHQTTDQRTPSPVLCFITHSPETGGEIRPFPE